ncbi:beta-hexosaminidase subunit beta-like isoform X1 [Watersipora subatra]|uniref:beta-hexosaminidase subunit beta-like isoform X1 n=1 Tax=Watersipora subatra TaxID=2589382 RepID=UPI00355B8E4B
MALKRFLTSHLLKRCSAVKLVLLLLFGIIFSYMLAGGFHADEPKPYIHEQPTLRMHPETVVERRMLNANEDSLESLRAPTTRVAKVLDNRNAGTHRLGQDRRGMDLSANGGNVPAPARIDTALTWDKPITPDELSRQEQWSKVSSYGDSAGGYNKAPINNKFEEKVGVKAADNVSTSSHSLSHVLTATSKPSKLNYNQQQVAETEANTQQQKNKPDNKALPIQSKIKSEEKKTGPYLVKAQAKNARTTKLTREKTRQWESYDYENPNNLLQIHVDRAPEHSEGVGTPWPMPQSYLTEPSLTVVDMDNFAIVPPAESCDRVDKAVERYTRHIRSKVDLYIPDGKTLRQPSSKQRVLRVLNVKLSRPCRNKELPHEHMSEQYKLSVSGLSAELSAQEPWGVIRGLETFSQLIYYSQGYPVINTTHIKDYPRFSFRGLMLDTARHYIPIRNLKRTLDVMSYNKLNVFHWHLVDDQSFPYVSKAFPNLSKLGAYSSDQIYTPTDILNLIDYAADRAIRVIPEFDSPGHTRSWGLGYPALLTNCSADYHPFGAVNPISNFTYEFMNTFWAEVHDLFPDSTVHVGGDEINYKCWLRLKKLREFMLEKNMTSEQYDYLTLDGDKLQGYYLKHLLEVMPRDRKKIAWEEAFSAAQMWNVSMDELIINVWKGGDYEWQYTMENVIRHGYKAVLSAPWYLNYISYGKDWTKYYEQDPHSFLTYSLGADTYKDYVLGGQVCVWAEYIDETNLEATLWPRASSPAEKFWSSAAMNDWRKAETRFENHRCRMTRRGVRAQPNSGPGSCKGRMQIKPPYEANTNF